MKCQILGFIDNKPQLNNFLNRVEKQIIQHNETYVYILHYENLFLNKTLRVIRENKGFALYSYEVLNDVADLGKFHNSNKIIFIYSPRENQVTLLRKAKEFIQRNKYTVQ